MLGLSASIEAHGASIDDDLAIFLERETALAAAIANRRRFRVSRHCNTPMLAD